MPERQAIQVVVGLGNPGPRYAETRHNAGFWWIEALARAYQGRFASASRFEGEACTVEVEGRRVRLLKPMAFMNRSGGAVQLLSAYFKVPLDEMLIVHDEIDLPPGRAKLKRGGGHGGHNGLRDIIARVGADFWRLRLGVGHPGSKDEVVDYVLSRPSEAERRAILAGIDEAAAVLPELIRGETDKAMQQLHSPPPGTDTEDGT